MAGIIERAAANRYLKAVLVPAFNKEFTVTAVEEGSAFTAWIGGSEQLRDILSVQESRVVGKDNTVRYCCGKLLIKFVRSIVNLLSLY